jgi:hypothetical protein
MMTVEQESTNRLSKRFDRHKTGPRHRAHLLSPDCSVLNSFGEQAPVALAVEAQSLGPQGSENSFT